MTDNKKLKQDATELLDKLIAFKKNHLTYSTAKGIDKSAIRFERDLRLILLIVRTDEENLEQYNRDRNT